MPKIPPFAVMLLLSAAGAAPARALPQEAGAASTTVALMASADMPDQLPGGGILLRGSRGLLDLVHRLEDRSATVASMLATLRARGVPITFGTFEEMEPMTRSAFHSYDPERSRALGYMAPRVRTDAHTGVMGTDEILVALNLTRLDELFAHPPRGRGTMRASWDDIQDLETLALLGHEIVHAYGLVVSGGDPRRGCADPRAGEAPETACVVIAENLVRRELGAPLDWGYGLTALPELAERYEAGERRARALRGIEAQNVLWARSFGGRLPLAPLAAPARSGTP